MYSSSANRGRGASFCQRLVQWMRSNNGSSLVQRNLGTAEELEARIVFSMDAINSMLLASSEAAMPEICLASDDHDHDHDHDHQTWDGMLLDAFDQLPDLSTPPAEVPLELPQLQWARV